MDDVQYKCFLELLMVSDPFPSNDPVNEIILKDFADQEAQKRGFKNWIEAYHSL